MNLALNYLYSLSILRCRELLTFNFATPDHSLSISWWYRKLLALYFASTDITRSLFCNAENRALLSSRCRKSITLNIATLKIARSQLCVPEKASSQCRYTGNRLLSMSRRRKSLARIFTRDAITLSLSISLCRKLLCSQFCDGIARSLPQFGDA